MKISIVAEEAPGDRGTGQVNVLIAKAETQGHALQRNQLYPHPNLSIKGTINLSWLLIQRSVYQENFKYTSPHSCILSAHNIQLTIKGCPLKFKGN